MSLSARFALLFRFLSALGIALWLGGMMFFGAVAAPALFRVARAEGVPEIAPQMVGALLSRFTFVTYACAALMLVGWSLDGILSRQRDKWWKLQGTLSVVSLALALYLGQIILPRTLEQQAQILPIFGRAERGQTLSPAEQKLRARFDAGHRTYQRLGSLNVWILLATLALLIARGTSRAQSLPTSRSNQAETDFATPHETVHTGS